MSKATYATFAAAAFTGLFFVFSLLYGVDPTDLNGTILSTLVPAVVPASAPFIGALGMILSVLAILGIAWTVLGAWEDSRKRGVAMLIGLLAGGLTLVSVDAAVVFWVIGLVVAAL